MTGISKLSWLKIGLTQGDKGTSRTLGARVFCSWWKVLLWCSRTPRLYVQTRKVQNFVTFLIEILFRPSLQLFPDVCRTEATRRNLNSYGIPTSFIQPYYWRRTCSRKVIRYISGRFSWNLQGVSPR